MQKMTNTELLYTSSGFLSGLDKQRRFLIKVGMAQKPCPNCGTLHNLPEAAGVSVDDFPFENHGSDRVGSCTKCKRSLIFVLPFVGDWHWRLDFNEATPFDSGK